MPIKAWDSPAPRRASKRASKIDPALLDSRWLDHLLDIIGAHPPITRDDLDALRGALRRYSAEVVRAAQFALRARAASEKAITRANARRFAIARDLRARARSTMAERLRRGRTRRVIVRELAKELKRTGKTVSAWTRDIA